MIVGQTESRPSLIFSAWRISEHADLSGIGGEYRDGRWHNASPDKPIVYLSEVTASAILEVLVHLNVRIDEFPRTYQLLRVTASQRITIKTLDREEHSYDPLPSRDETAAIGDAWLASGESALARVPAVVAPYTWNYLLNPRHPDAAHVKITSQRRLPFDSRLFGARSSGVGA